MVDAELVKVCEETAKAAQDALGWVAEPKKDALVGQERAFLERAIRSQAYRARQLARSVDRPVCVGVFGPSQAENPILSRTLTALFNDSTRPEVDFIRDINPYGEKEATGRVTRFSIERPTTPTGFPVPPRLLTQTDVLKILCNSYFFDGDLEAEEPLAPSDTDAHIAQFEARQGQCYSDVLRKKDVWDVEEYFQRQLRQAEAKVFCAVLGAFDARRTAS